MTEFCYNHPNSKARFRCNKCGQPICNSCLTHEARHFCPQCTGHFPSATHVCSNHSDRFASFMCLRCGKVFCNIDKMEVRKTSGNYVYKIWAGCPDSRKCDNYLEYKSNLQIYKEELREFREKNKGSICNSCGKKYSEKKLHPKLKLSRRLVCKNCKDVIEFHSSIPHFNVLDDSDLLKNALKPKRKDRPSMQQGFPKFCQECGTKLSSPSKFCPECGQKL